MKQRIFGYARVSGKEQNLNVQMKALLEYGIKEENIFQDKQRGKNSNRVAYQSLIKHILHSGDVLVIKSMEQLGKNYGEIKKQWEVITTGIGAYIVVLDMPSLDTRKPEDTIELLISDIVLQVLSFAAEQEKKQIKKDNYW